MKVLIFQTAFIGDVILCTQMIKKLFEDGHEVGFVVKPEASDILSKNKELKWLHIYDKRAKDKGFKGIFTLAKEIRKNNYDVALVPHRSIRSAAIVWLAKISKRIGFDRSAGSFLFSDKINYKKNIHEVERNNSLLTAISIPDNKIDPYTSFDEKDEHRVGKYFSENNIGENSKIIGVGPGSKWFTKQWGIENYKTLVEKIISNSEFKVVCFGGPEDKVMCEEIVNLSSDKILNTAGVFNLCESAAAMNKISTLITNDNGLMHLSAASKVPVTAIFGPTVPEMGFSPWGKDHSVIGIDLDCRPCSSHGTAQCPKGHFKCMKDTTPEMVFNNIKKYLH